MVTCEEIFKILNNRDQTVNLKLRNNLCEEVLLFSIFIIVVITEVNRPEDG